MRGTGHATGPPVSSSRLRSDFGPYPQFFFGIEPINSFRIHAPAVPSQQARETSVLAAHMARRQLTQAYSQRAFGTSLETRRSLI
jgi:hypothetical protein